MYCLANALFCPQIAQVTTQSDGEGQLHFNSRTARELDLTKLKGAD